jgi:hypothetical protein
VRVARVARGSTGMRRGRRGGVSCCAGVTNNAKVRMCLRVQVLLSIEGSRLWGSCCTMRRGLKDILRMVSLLADDATGRLRCDAGCPATSLRPRFGLRC